ncbi:MAG: hypothetical protein OEY89_00370, partial [Gammaproteobacteria bacterium]|nr:hypothetical protein [Gammaproteobacteria bacterium]
MKIFKYLLKPVKIILYLSIFTAIIYYRSLIFQPEVNNYIAMPLSYIEEELNIEIPAHVRTENNNEIATHSIDQGASDSVLINDKAAEQYAVINSVPISDNTSYL